MPRALVVALFLPSAAFAADPCGQGDSDGRAHGCVVREITLPARAVLAVDGRENGGIGVSGQDRPDIRVVAKVATTAPTEARARELAAEIEILTAGGSIRADGPPKTRELHWSVSYEIAVPRETDLDLVAHNGGLSVDGMDARITLETTNGGLDLREVNGEVRGTTVNGGVSVALSGAGWEGAGLDVRTTNGGIQVLIPRDYAADLEVSTVSGGVAVDGPTVRQPGGRVAASLGGGGAPIRLATTNGAVSVASE